MSEVDLYKLGVQVIVDYFMLRAAESVLEDAKGTSDEVNYIREYESALASYQNSLRGFESRDNLETCIEVYKMAQAKTLDETLLSDFDELGDK